MNKFFKEILNDIKFKEHTILLEDSLNKKFEKFEKKLKNY